MYSGAPAGYTLDPQENIVYVSAHDNETMFDAVQVKAAAATSLTNRIRMNNLALSIPMFSQGIPFFHAGDDILRSKSLDRNSYDSGDWYNAHRLDLHSSNNWGIGLPIEGADNWDIFRPLLGNTTLRPNTAQITGASSVFQEYLQIRKSSALFRLTTAEQVTDSVSFLNTGPKQIPGLIVMRLKDVDDVDPTYAEVLVFFNANQKAIKFTDAALANQEYQLHPVLAGSVDRVVKQSANDAVLGAFSIPALTTSVFVLED